MLTKEHDIVIIGGGIQGAGCAQAAAAAGYSICLLEKNSWGSATSSHSSKLIHGGLRYFETYQFGLVWKSLHERKILMEIAAPLVKPLPFYIPVYQQSRRQPWMIFTGLSLYSLMGGFNRLSRFRCIPKNKWQDLDGLKTGELKRVYQYWDTQTDDYLLTLAVVRSAEKLGAEIHEYTEFIKADKDSDGYTVKYKQANTEKRVKCRVIINASGPWTAEVQKFIYDAPPSPEVELVQGSHIELEGRLSEAIFYLESPVDRRAMFVMPWHNNTLVGTTETAFSGNPADARATDEDIDYLLKTVRHYFPDFKCNVIDQFAGLRVLSVQKTGFSERRRDTLIQYDNVKYPKLVSLYGGKLTTYRATSEEVLNRIRRTLGDRGRIKDTKEIFLTVPKDE
jgi:glycerol-3-phosphate dehydrogenase